MTDFKVQTRPEGAPGPSRSTRSRHRAESTAPASALSRFAAGLGSTGRRAALAATACAVLVGVGAAGYAAEPANHPSAATGSGASATTADPLTQLNFEQVRSATQTSELPGASVDPESGDARAAEAPAAAAAPAPAAPAPAAVPAPAAPAPEPAKPVAVDDPAGAQAYAASQLGSYGWDAGQMPCLMKLWTKESDWKTTATNKSSGAYGVVQSLPAEKMASAGADYRTNYRTQINWGLNYVKQRYGSPCGALNFHYANNWY